ncbi:MAG: hypothetical protein AAF721_28095 [Myxococcota bacterium]
MDRPRRRAASCRWSAVFGAAITITLGSGCPKPDEPMGDGTDGSSDGTTGGTTAAVDETSGMPVDVPARGIVISRVDVNSGVAITVAEGDTLLAPEDRSPIPKNRNTAVRVYVDIDEDVWVQRDIEARLTLVAPDGSEETMTLTETIAADSSETNLQSNFLFGATADLIVPDVAYRVALFETGSDYETLPEPATAPAVPSSGTAYLGVQSSTQRMRVMLLPVQYSAPDGGSCETTIDTSEENVARYADALFQHNPTEDVEIMVHEPWVIDDIDLSLTAPIYVLLTRLSQLRADESPDPDVYYYALFDNCSACITSDGTGGFNGCLLGVAAGIPEATQGAAAIRVAVGVQSSPSSDDSGIDTFVHEIGHGQGRNHVACPGQSAAAPEPGYPYDNGSIGVWGFGVLDFMIRNPSNHSDYMSYCTPTWASDWQWDATFSRIQTLSSWGFGTERQVPPPGPEAVMLVGMLNPSTGEQHWWTDRGTLTAADYQSDAWPLAYVMHDGSRVSSTAAVNAWSEGPWVSVRAPLSPATAVSLQSVELTTAARTLTVQASAIAGERMRKLRAAPEPLD